MDRRTDGETNTLALRGLEEPPTLRVGWRNRKKSSSRLSGGCTIVITTEKKSSSRLSGGYTIVITTGKKSSSCLSGGCAITAISTTGPIYAKSSDFYAKLNVSNLNVTNLY